MSDESNDNAKDVGLLDFIEGTSVVDELVNTAIEARFDTDLDHVVTMGLLYAYTSDPHVQLTDDQWLKIRNDSRLSKLLEKLREQSRIVVFPRLAAASSEDLWKREAGGFQIQVTPPSAGKDTSIVAVTRLDAEDAGPTIMFLRRKDGTERKVEIPNFDQGRAIFLMEQTDAALTDLLDAEVEIEFA